ncbi:hypothetical protein HK405_001043, partial [Cladochytrium tenue]
AGAVRRHRRTVAKALAANGVSISVHFSSEESNSRTEQVASSLSKEFGTKTTVVVGKVQSFDDAKTTIEQILADFATTHIDILSNLTPLMGVTSKQLSIECTVNVLSVIYLVQAVVCVGKVPKDGRIVNMSSSTLKLLAPSLIEADGSSSAL